MKRINSVLLFLFPIVLIIITFLFLKITPFGSRTIWYIDLPGQIILFYNHLYDVLHGQGSILYTWKYGMGTDFWPTFSYYLSSPLSLLVVFFPRHWIPYVVILIYLIKLGLASLTMNFLLKKLFNLKDIYYFIFSTSYALMSFSITYYFLPMWLDSIYLLPLIILSVHFILLNNRNKLFIVTLTTLFISNFYISYMTGIFVFLYFIKELYIGNYTKKEYIKKLKLFFSGVFLAASFSMFIILPTYFQIKNNNYASGDYQIKGFSYNPLDIYHKFLSGTTELQNLSIYVGLIAVLLVPLYFVNKNYPLKERLSNLVFLSFMLLSVASNFLNYVWHIFEAPNGALYRFAFTISFLLILLSVKSISALEKNMLPHLVRIYGFNLILISLVNKILKPDNSNLNNLFFNIFILTLIFIILVIKMGNVQIKFRQLLSILLLGVVTLDLFYNTAHLFNSYSLSSGQWNEPYDPAYRNTINYIASNDNSFYRIIPETELVSTENESLKYGYKGMSLYTSTGNGNLNSFLASLGYPADTRTVKMGNGIFVSDTLLSFQYKISLKQKDTRIYKKVYEEGDLKAYKNKFSLPLGILVNKEQFTLLDKETTWLDKQNMLLGSYKGNSSYYKVNTPKASRLNNLVLNPDMNMYVKVDPSSPAYIEHTVKINNLEQLYLKLNGEDYNNYDQFYSIEVNEKNVESAKLNLLNSFDLGTFEKEEVNVKIHLNSEVQSINVPEIYTLNYSLLGNRISELNQNTLDLQQYSDTFISGKIRVPFENVLFLSIPYDKDWNITVDGKNVESIKLGEFLGVRLTKGNHEIEIKYSPKPFYVSLLFSTVVFVSYLFYVLVVERKRKLKRISL